MFNEEFIILDSESTFVFFFRVPLFWLSPMTSGPNDLNFRASREETILALKYFILNRVISS